MVRKTSQAVASVAAATIAGSRLSPNQTTAGRASPRQCGKRGGRGGKGVVSSGPSRRPPRAATRGPRGGERRKGRAPGEPPAPAVRAAGPTAKPPDRSVQAEQP